MGVNIGLASSCCNTVQQALVDISQGNVTTLKIQNHGMLQWVTSDANRSGFTAVPLQSPNGKNQTVNITYWQNPRTSATTSRPNICSTGSTTAEKYATFTPDLYASVKLTLDERQFREFCSTPPAGSDIRASRFAQEQVMALMNQLYEQIDQDAVTYASTHRSNFYNGVAPGTNGKTVKLVKSDESPSQGGIMDVRKDMMDARVIGTPAAVGSGYIWTVTEFLKYACCSTAGIDLSRLDSSPWVQYYDLNVDSIMAGTNNFFMLAPGALQIVPVVDWIGAYDDVATGNALPTEAKTNILAEVPGGGTLPLDFTVRREFCGTNNDGDSKWVLTWTAHYGFYNVPSDLEPVGSPFRSVNGIFHYRATCGAAACSDVAS